MVSAVGQGPPSAIAQGRLSRKAREGAHPQLFRFTLTKDKLGVYFPVKVAHPPISLIDPEVLQSVAS